MMLRLIGWAVVCVVFTGACAASGPDDAGSKRRVPSFQLNLPAPGAADGATSLLSEPDQARLTGALDRMIEGAERTIAGLEADIARLEESNRNKAYQADELVRQIASRESELNDQYNRNLVLCLWFPDPSICVLANVLANDSRLNDLKNQLNAARSEQSRIYAEIAAYTARRDALRAQLAPVRESRERLSAIVRGTLPEPTIPETAALSGAAREAYRRFKLAEQLEPTIEREIEILVDIRDAALELAAVLDEALVTIRALAASAEELVKDARTDFLDAFEALLTGDPGAHAARFLEDEIARRTRAALDSLGWPRADFARHVVLGDGLVGAEADAMVERLLSNWSGAGAPNDPVDDPGSDPETQPFQYSSETAVSVLDLTSVASVIRVGREVTASRVEVTVDLSHSYRGDLRVWVERGEYRHTLFEGKDGDSASDLKSTFELTDVGDVSTNGNWTLHVEDRLEADEGTLHGWSLMIYPAE